MTSPWEPFSIYNTLGSWPAQTREASHSFTPNALNQYAAIDTTRTPTYDLSGNMVDDGAGRTFSFDSENRLMSGTKSPDAWFEYDYDPFGRRVMKFVEVGNMDTETRYVYDGPHCIAETDLSGAIQRKFIYGPGIDEPLMMIVVDDYYQTETKYYYHRDALGNVMALSDANGNIVEGYTYSAFGIATVNRSAGTDGDWLTPDGTTSDKSAKGNPYMFTGRRYDPESGLYYYRARYYDATLGRFISADPISYAGGINLQAYCNNNPVNFRDPMGLDWVGGGGFGDDRDQLADGGGAWDGAGANPRAFGSGGASGSEKDKQTENDSEYIILPNGQCILVPKGFNIYANMIEASEMSIFEFRDYVKAGGPWDYKTLGSKNGEITHPEYEALGNVNYGACGRACGISERRLLREAGRVQRGPNRRGDPGHVLNPFGGTPPYGDNPDDVPYIGQGFTIYDESGKMDIDSPWPLSDYTIFWPDNTD